MKLYEARASWLHSYHGSDQWSSVGLWSDKIADNLRAEAAQVLCADGRPERILGTITISRDGDPQFWGASPGPALYLAKLATDPELSGMGLGRLLLDWAIDHAHRNALPEVRLDAWKTSTRLHQYYLARGWMSCGVDSDTTRRSGALFARPSAPVNFGGWLLLSTSDRREETENRKAVQLVSDDDMEPPTQELPHVLVEGQRLSARESQRCCQAGLPA
jgi:GNAT superfamily N-acetyltransferase